LSRAEGVTDIRAISMALVAITARRVRSVAINSHEYETAGNTQAIQLTASTPISH
jgi:hypothetical protein